MVRNLLNDAVERDRAKKLPRELVAVAAVLARAASRRTRAPVKSDVRAIEEALDDDDDDADIRNGADIRSSADIRQRRRRA